MDIKLDSPIPMPRKPCEVPRQFVFWFSESPQAPSGEILSAILNHFSSGGFNSTRRIREHASLSSVNH